MAGPRSTEEKAVNVEVFNETLGRKIKVVKNCHLEVAVPSSRPLVKA